MGDKDADSKESTGPKYRDPEWLRQKYHGEQKSVYEISDECSVEPQTVWRWMERHDIERRSLSDSHLHEGADKRYQNAEWLREQYVDKAMTQYEIADVCGVKQHTVYRWMKRHGIESRGQSESQNPSARVDLLQDAEWLAGKYHGEALSIYEIADICNSSGATVGKWLRRHGIDVREGTEKQTRHADSQRFTDAGWLREEYIENGRSIESLADECGVHERTIAKYLRENDIDIRPRVAYREDHPNWNGGYPNDYGPNYKANRLRAFERDGGCAICGMSNERHREMHGESLHCHHITPIAWFRSNFDTPEWYERANALENLIILCEPHHYRWEGIPLRPM